MSWPDGGQYSGPARPSWPGRGLRCHNVVATRGGSTDSETDMTGEANTANQIVYRPTLIGRAARLGLPVLQKVLPGRSYQLVYDGLYNSYKWSLRQSYTVKVGWAYLTKGKVQRLRASLTRRLLPYSMGGHRALENAFDVTAMVEKRKIPGALVECGVAQGGTAAMMAMTSRALGSGRRQNWWFDSYEGLPEPTPEDYVDGRAGEFIRPLPKGSCLGTVEQVEELAFDTLDLPREDVHLVKGWFQDTVPPARDKVGPIAVLRLDGDWYESTKVPLDNFYDRLSPGGFVIVDDYATCFGSRRAVDEFRAERNIATPIKEDGRGGIWFEKPAH